MNELADELSIAGYLRIEGGRLLQNDEKKILIAALRQPTAPAEERERIAFELWQRFAPVHHIGWKDETHKAEYYAAADAVLAALPPTTPPSDERARAVEECAKIVDAMCAEILSKQTQTSDPLSMTDTINGNLRMMACILPDIAKAIRALIPTDAAAAEKGR